MGELEGEGTGNFASKHRILCHYFLVLMHCFLKIVLMHCFLKKIVPHFLKIVPHFHEDRNRVG